MPPSTLTCGPRIQASWRLAYGACSLCVCNNRGNSGRYCLGNLILKREYISELVVVARSPDVLAGFTFHQLRCDPDPIASLAHTAFQRIAHTEFASDLPHIYRAVFVGKARVSRDDEQRRVARQRCDDVLCNTIADKLLNGVFAHIDEGKYRDRRLVRQW